MRKGGNHVKPVNRLSRSGNGEETHPVPDSSHETGSSGDDLFRTNGNPDNDLFATDHNDRYNRLFSPDSRLDYRCFFTDNPIAQLIADRHGNILKNNSACH